MGITKRYRLVIDYEVEVSDWETTGWHGPDFYRDFGTPEFNELAENQRRLFDAVMKDPKRVDQMCQRSLLDTLEMDLGNVRRQFAVPAEDNLYGETFAEMSPEDREWWENICREGLFAENADFVTYRFQPHVQSCTMQNLETGELIEGQPYQPSNGDSVFHGAEAFGTWARPEVERYDRNDEELEEMRKQVSLAEELPESVKEFLQRFVIQRTIFTHVNPDTPNAMCSDEQIIREANEWVADNPVLSNQDLLCLKRILNKLDLRKFFRHNFIQDMRKRTFDRLCRAVLQHEQVLVVKIP
jgi:hypothetical protein